MTAKGPQTITSVGAESTGALTGAQTLLLAISVAIAGGSVMVVELMGTRVLAPVFGSSLYIWSSQISVALLSLTIGYPLGGYVADRYPRLWCFYFINALSGVAIAFCMVIRGSVLAWTSTWGDARIATLVSSLILFTPSLVMMGMVGPFAARLFVRDMSRIGITIGKLSALSAGGSIVGSIATGFYLMPNYSIVTTMISVAVILILIGVVGMLITRAWLAGTATLIVGGLMIGFVYGGMADTKLQDELADKGVTILYEGSSPYGDIKVVDVPLARFMYIGQMIQTIDQKDEDGPRHITTLHDMAYVAYSMRPQAKDVLLIGLAGGTKVKFFNERHIAVDTIEIDPMVVDKAKEYFGIEENELSRIIIQDGRPYMNRCEKKYDILIMDVFGGGVAPSHLFSIEAVAAMKKCLKPNGLLMMNCLNDKNDPGDMLLADVQKTIEASGDFKNRRVYEWRPHTQQGIKNYFTFASDGSLTLEIPLPDMMSPHHASDLADAFEQVEIDMRNAVVVTDDRNPLDMLQISHNEKLRQVALNDSESLRLLFDPRRPLKAD